MNNMEAKIFLSMVALFGIVAGLNVPPVVYSYYTPTPHIADHIVTLPAVSNRKQDHDDQSLANYSDENHHEPTKKQEVHYHQHEHVHEHDHHQQHVHKHKQDHLHEHKHGHEHSGKHAHQHRNEHEHEHRHESRHRHVDHHTHQSEHEHEQKHGHRHEHKHKHGHEHKHGHHHNGLKKYGHVYHTHQGHFF